MDMLLFAELDPGNYQIYKDTFIDLTSPPVFDPYVELGFWCVLCPDGADCTQPGVFQANVTAQESYFMGVDNTGTVFFPCLNDACTPDGDRHCASGYTGPSCTECEPNLVLADGFTCEQCPSEIISILAFLGGLSVFVLYLLYKVKKKQNGEAPSLSGVYTKITLSTFQVQL